MKRHAHETVCTTASPGRPGPRSATRKTSNFGRNSSITRFRKHTLMETKRATFNAQRLAHNASISRARRRDNTSPRSAPKNEIMKRTCRQDWTRARSPCCDLYWSKRVLVASHRLFELQSLGIGFWHMKRTKEEPTWRE